MLKIGSVRWKGRCHKHPSYDPQTDGLGGIRGGCTRCDLLLEIWMAHSKLVRLMRDFGVRDDRKAARSTEEQSRQMSLLDS
jgi:hypothetical protein